MSISLELLFQAVTENFSILRRLEQTTHTSLNVFPSITKLFVQSLKRLAGNDYRLMQATQKKAQFLS